MSRSQQMVIASIVFGTVIALTALYARSALIPIAIVGGLLLGLGWSFYAQNDGVEATGTSIDS